MKTTCDFEASLKQYLHEIKKNLCCDRKAKTSFLRDFESNIREYLENNPEDAFEELVAHFGTPEAIAHEFFADAEDYCRRENRSKKRVRIVLLIILAVILLLVGIVTTIIATNNHRTAGYYYDEEVADNGNVSLS